MNAKEEFLNTTRNLDVLCVSITYQNCWNSIQSSIHNLPVGYTEKEYTKFIESLDFKYDNGFGGQELFGLIWYKDGSWSSRGEYDGSEWWNHNECPIVPENLK